MLLYERHNGDVLNGDENIVHWTAKIRVKCTYAHAIGEDNNIFGKIFTRSIFYAISFYENEIAVHFFEAKSFFEIYFLFKRNFRLTFTFFCDTSNFPWIKEYWIVKRVSMKSISWNKHRCDEIDEAN